MKTVFCFTGKTFKGPFVDVIDDYRKRISKHAPVEIIEAKNLRLQTREGVHVVLSPEGREMNSIEFASYISENLVHGTKNMFFYIGGPDGLEDDIMKRADLKLSFSQMTFNHQIFRTMLLEQVYRAFTIINNEPYHR